VARTPGSPAPQVTATTQDDETVALDFERPTVPFFYPRDVLDGVLGDGVVDEADAGRGV